jgi:hypothetical protein
MNSPGEHVYRNLNAYQEELMTAGVASSPPIEGLQSEKGGVTCA